MHLKLLITNTDIWNVLAWTLANDWCNDVIEIKIRPICYPWSLECFVDQLQCAVTILIINIDWILMIEYVLKGDTDQNVLLGQCPGDPGRE